MNKQIELGASRQSLKATFDEWNVRRILPLLLQLKLTANHLTGLRLMLGLLVAVLVFSGQPFLAIVLFIIAAVTDYYDGLLARATNSTSAWGKRWDERADKILIIAVVLAKVAFEYRVQDISAEMYMLLDLLSATVLRDAIVIWARKNGLAKTEVLWSAKIKTTVQMIAVGLLIIGVYGHGIMYFGYVLFFIATLLSLYSGWVYIKPLREQCERLAQ